METTKKRCERSSATLGRESKKSMVDHITTTIRSNPSSHQKERKKQGALNWRSPKRRVLYTKGMLHIYSSSVTVLLLLLLFFLAAAAVAVEPSRM